MPLEYQYLNPFSDIVSLQGNWGNTPPDNSASMGGSKLLIDMPMDTSSVNGYWDGMDVLSRIRYSVVFTGYYLPTIGSHYPESGRVITVSAYSFDDKGAYTFLDYITIPVPTNQGLRDVFSARVYASGVVIGHGYDFNNTLVDFSTSPPTLTTIVPIHEVVGTLTEIDKVGTVTTTNVTQVFNTIVPRDSNSNSIAADRPNPSTYDYIHAYQSVYMSRIQYTSTTSLITGISLNGDVTVTGNSYTTNLTPQEHTYTPAPFYYAGTELALRDKYIGSIIGYDLGNYTDTTLLIEGAVYSVTKGYRILNPQYRTTPNELFKAFDVAWVTVIEPNDLSATPSYTTNPPVRVALIQIASRPRWVVRYNNLNYFVNKDDNLAVTGRDYWVLMGKAPLAYPDMPAPV